MIVEFYDYDSEDDTPIGKGDWPCVPNVGDSCYFEGVSYTVKARDWGTFVNGLSEALWNQPFCSITLVKANKLLSESREI